MLFNKNTQPWLLSFARRRGKGFTQNQQYMLDHVLPRYQLDLPDDPSERLAFDQPVQIEVGFGTGDHLLLQAQAHPDVLFIGCEPYLNGVAHLLQGIEKHGISNIRIYPDDVRKLLMRLPDHTVDKIFMLFPDPWPKGKHHKRRLLNDETLSMFSRVLKEKGMLRLATDHEHYGNWILAYMTHHRDFEWTARCKHDWLYPPSDWVPTRYEQKARESGNDRILYLTYLRSALDMA